MTHRERVISALNHDEPDRVPIDLGGCLASGIVVEAYRNLRKKLALPDREPEPAWKYTGLATIDEDVRQALDVDIIHASLPAVTKRGVRVLEDGSFVDEWGVRWSKPEGGHYYVKRPPLAEDASEQVLDSYPWPHPDDPDRVAGLAESLDELRKTDYAISMELHGRVMSIGQFLRGFEQWMVDIATDSSLVHRILERTTDIQIQINDHLLRCARDKVDIVYTSDDLGGQNGLLVSPHTFRKLLKPYFERIFSHIRENTSAKLMHHCCGSIRPIIADLVEMGVEALNPIQVSAKDMDPVELKREFGRKLTLWGAVDTREVMPRGSTEDVRREVRGRIEELARGGGYILCAVHNLQKEVPPANIIAMYDEAKKSGRYPTRTELA